MGKEYGSNSTVSSVFEASGAGGFFAVDSKSVSSGKRIETKKEPVEITKAWSINVEDTTMDSQSKMADDSKDGDITNLLQTDLLLIAVLIVCFITLASVIAICGCMIRRYCKKREQQTAMGVHQPAVVSKSTSITGLNLARENCPTKVEKSNQEFSPTVIQQTTYEEAVSCEPNSEAAVLGPTGSSSMTTELNSARLLKLHHTGVVSPMYGQKDSPLTSTPAISKPHCDNGGDVQCVEGGIYSISPDLRNPATKVVSQVSCDTLISTLCDQSKDIEENPSRLEEQSADVTYTAAQVLMRAPLTHSMSWFVSLNGDRTGSIRHSITDNTYQELNMKNYDNCPPDQKNSKHSHKVKGQKNPECHPLYELDERDSGESQPMSVSSNMLNNDSTCLATDEKVPLIEKMRHSSASAPRSAATKQSNLATVVENEESRKTKSLGTLPQSLSLPDDSNTWKQREERPVLFLGSGVK